MEIGQRKRIQSKQFIYLMIIQSGSNEVTELIIEKGANITISNNAGDTALHFAAQNGKIIKIKKMIKLTIRSNIIKT